MNIGLEEGGRLRFGVARSGAPFPSMMVVFRPSDADLT